MPVDPALADIAAQFESLLASAVNLIIQNSLIILLAVLGLLFVSDLFMRFRKGQDPRAGFLAEVLGVSEDQVIPLPPASALWNDLKRLNFEADAGVFLPAGAITLQGSYLVMAHHGLTLVAVHNFERDDLYLNEKSPELVDAVTGKMHPSGRFFPQRFPVEIEQDAIRRANIVQMIMERHFGFEGALKVCTLLRDAQGKAPEVEHDATSSGEVCERFTFDDEMRLQKFLTDVHHPVEIDKPEVIARFFTSWPSRQTGRLRQAWRLGLAGICLAIILASGEFGISPETFWNMFG